jgi:protein arginine kinase activator
MQYCTACQKALATIVIMDLNAGSLVGQQHLCAACAENLGVVQPKTQIKVSSEVLENLLGNLKGAKTTARERSKTVCPGCGMSAADFKTKGRLGCPRCYETFRGELIPVLQRVHESAVHRGRLPGRVASRERGPADGLAEIRRRLEDAVRGERYEEAARLRDELREAERAGDAGNKQ